MEESPDGSPHYIQDYAAAIRGLQPKDKIVFRSRTGTTEFTVGPRGVLGGQSFSVVVDVGNKRVLRLNTDAEKDGLSPFAESQLRMKRAGCPVVEVYSHGRVGGRSAYVEVGYEDKLVTLADVVNRLSPPPPSHNRGLQQQYEFQRQEVVALGLDKIEAAFMEFIDKSAGFAVLDDVHPDNLVLVRRSDGGVEFKVWDTGTDQPTTTRWLNHDDLDHNRSFLDEEKFQLAFRGYLKPWWERAKQRMMESRRRLYPSLADRVGSKELCSAMDVL